jgi:hypothetical protein
LQGLLNADRETGTESVQDRVRETFYPTIKSNPQTERKSMKKNWQRRQPDEVERAIAVGKAQEQMKEFAAKIARLTMTQREEIITAFMVKHGFDVDDCVQEFGALSGNRWTWRVRERTEAEKEAMNKAAAMRQIESAKINATPVKVYVPLRKTWWMATLPDKVYFRRELAEDIAHDQETEVREIELVL